MYFYAVYKFSTGVTGGNANKSEKAFNEATELATKKLHPTHPIRLGLALNFSVFYYENANKPDKACQMAKKVMNDSNCTNKVTLIQVVSCSRHLMMLLNIWMN